MGDLSGKVAVITGAGRGLGRAEALGLAKLGARIVVNDINLPDAMEAANATVEEIKALGGEAITVFGDCADTADSENLFKQALDAFGDVNIMINNAGYCRDKTIFGMSDEEFDSVVRVHLRGHFVNMRNATKYWRDKAKQEGSVYGRLISTSSEASIFGSAGQPNYAAAKAGITAMTMGAAQLMIKYGVTCNVIMPRALTNMTNSGHTADAFKAPEEGFHQFDPDNVSPLVSYLCSPEAGHISGEAFVVWGGDVKIVQRPQLNVTYANPKGGKWEVDDLHATLSEYFNEDHKTVWDGYSVIPQ
jgi:NAD(P)-dependent dehydrogenase (short-subunit alcohol dehydrogenase family)